MKLMSVLLVLTLVATIGCGGSEELQNANGGSPESSPYMASSEPENAIPVGQARESAEDDQSVTLVGRIGGSSKPFVDGLAAFTIVDPKVPYCSPDEGCPTPWDYCCTQDQVKGNIATVKIVDESGNPIEDDARKLLGAKELSTVVVQGTAKRDSEGNLTIAASKVFVRPGE